MDEKQCKESALFVEQECIKFYLKNKPSPSQNPYVEKLQEFSSFVFTNVGSFQGEKNQWRGFFENRSSIDPQKLILEIGCSNALYLEKTALQHPNWAFVGIDWKYKLLYRGAKRLQGKKILNVALLRGHAHEWLKVLGSGEVDEIFIFFPDPWPRRSQLKHRLLNEKFLVEASRVLSENGRLYFKTDHPAYFQFFLALFGEREIEVPTYDHFLQVGPGGFAGAYTAGTCAGSASDNVGCAGDKAGRKSDTIPGGFAGAYTAGTCAGSASDNVGCVGDKLGRKSDTIQSKRARQIQMRKPSPVNQLPLESSQLIGLFNIERYSLDFWSSAAQAGWFVAEATVSNANSIQHHEVSCLTIPTPYEKKFMQDKLPIFFVELKKK